MKHFGMFLIAAVGGVLGAFAYRSVGPSNGVAPGILGPAGIHGEASARLRDEIRQLRDRVTKLEHAPEMEAAMEGRSSTWDGVLPELVQQEVLEAARAAVRDEMKTVAQAASGETRSAVEREVALELCLEQLSAPHEDTRRNGIRRLRRMFASEASPQVLPLLDDESAMVRLEAAAYFEYLWDPAALEPLMGMMHEEDVEVAEQALDALCKSGEERAMAELQEYYLKGPVLEMAYEAGKALEENRHRAALPDGVARFRHALASADPRERQLGVAGLGRWGSIADEPLVRRLETDEDAGVRTQVERTLQAWGLQPAK